MVNKLQTVKEGTTFLQFWHFDSTQSLGALSVRQNTKLGCFDCPTVNKVLILLTNWEQFRVRGINIIHDIHLSGVLIYTYNIIYI